MKKTILLCLLMTLLGTMASANGSMSQGNYRWRNDDGSIENATNRSAENVNSNIVVGNNIRLRVELHDLDADSSLEFTDIGLYYSIDSTNWILINNSENDFQLSLSTFYDESDTINDMLSNSNSQPIGGGFTIENTVLKTFTFYKETSYEVEYCFKATSNAFVDTTYMFALRHNDERFHNIINYPKLTILSPSLSVSPSNKGVSNLPGTTTIFLINSNTNWTISDNAPWLTTSITSGSGVYSFTATFTENTTPTTRIATITVSSDGVPDVEVTVTQTGSPVPLNSLVQNVTVSGSEVECYNATSIIIVAGFGTSVDIMSGGQATFIAGNKILFEPGFSAFPGSYCHGYITESGNYCSQEPPVVATQNSLKEEEGEEEGEEKVGVFPELITEDDAGVNIYPNPTSGKFTINFKGNVTTADIFLMNFQGNRVLETSCDNQNKKIIDIGHLPGGMYMIVVKSNSQIFTKKIILK